MGSDKMGSDKMSSVRMGSDKMGSDKMGSDKMGSDKSGNPIHSMRNPPLVWIDADAGEQAAAQAAGKTSETLQRDLAATSLTSLVDGFLVCDVLSISCARGTNRLGILSSSRASTRRSSNSPIAANDEQALGLHQSINREIAAGQQHVFAITAGLNQFLSVEIEVWGIELSGTLSDPAGEPQQNSPPPAMT